MAAAGSKLGQEHLPDSQELSRRDDRYTGYSRGHCEPRQSAFVVDRHRDGFPDIDILQGRIVLVHPECFVASRDFVGFQGVTGDGFVGINLADINEPARRDLTRLHIFEDRSGSLAMRKTILSR